MALRRAKGLTGEGRFLSFSARFGVLPQCRHRPTRRARTIVLSFSVTAKAPITAEISWSKRRGKSCSRQKRVGLFKARQPLWTRRNSPRRAVLLAVGEERRPSSGSSRPRSAAAKPQRCAGARSARGARSPIGRAVGDVLPPTRPRHCEFEWRQSGATTRQDRGEGRTECGGSRPRWLTGRARDGEAVRRSPLISSEPGRRGSTFDEGREMPLLLRHPKADHPSRRRPARACGVFAVDLGEFVNAERRANHFLATVRQTCSMSAVAEARQVAAQFAACGRCRLGAGGGGPP